LDLLDAKVTLDSLLGDSIREVSIVFLDIASLILLSAEEQNNTQQDSQEKLDSNSISILCLKLISIFCKYGLSVI
jgi:hypothetical protein